MKKKNWAFLAITAVLLALSLIAFRPSSKSSKPPTSPTCCKKTEKCTRTEKDAQASPNEFLLESLSRQFISIGPISY